MLYTQYKILNWIAAIKRELSQKLSESQIDMILDHIMSTEKDRYIAVVSKETSVPKCVETYFNEFSSHRLFIEGTIAIVEETNDGPVVNFNVLEPLIFFGMKRDYSAIVVIYRPDLEKLNQELQLFGKYGHYLTK